MSVQEFREKIILASSSPRRAELLKSAGWDFSVVPPDENAEGGICTGETPPELVARLAYQKAENVAKKHAAGIFVGCDTVGEVNGQILGKPSDRAHAKAMLNAMSGREHRVFSGICIWQRPKDRTLLRVAVTKLSMDRLSEDALEDYLESNQWQGKAGAFGYQDGLGWVHILEGSESNVVGLPMEELDEMLNEMKANSN